VLIFYLLLYFFLKMHSEHQTGELVALVVVTKSVTLVIDPIPLMGISAKHTIDIVPVCVVVVDDICA